MIGREFWALEGVLDAEVEGGLLQLLTEGARTDARVVAHLAEVEARRLHLRGGVSLWEYCLRLGLSESEAHYRICAARAGRAFPVVFGLLERREVNLTTLALVGKYLTLENHLQLLAEVRGKTKRQVLEVLARRWPKAEVLSNVRRLSVGATTVAAGPSGRLEPRADDSYCLQLQIDGKLEAKLALARDLMSHANPTSDLAVVVERGLDVLIEKLRARRFGQTTKRRNTVRAPQHLGQQEQMQKGAARATEHFGQTESGVSGNVTRKRRHVQHEVRRQVAARDGYCCSYISAGGQRCGARAFLELDHERAWARGGDDSVENLRLLCRAHNQFLAKEDFGERAVTAKTAAGRM